MYLAQTNTLQSQAPFYINILEGIIEGVGYDAEVKQDIDNAINEAIDVVNGEKDYFSIDNSHYFLITTLLTKCKDALKKFENQRSSNELYHDILLMLNS